MSTDTVTDTFHADAAVRQRRERSRVQFTPGPSNDGGQEARLEHTSNNRKTECSWSLKVWSTGSYESCPRPISIGRTDKSTGEVDHLEVPCNCKHCPYCGPKLKRRRTAHLVEEYADAPNVRFVTLTLDPKALPSGCDSFDSSRGYLMSCWRDCRERIRYHTECDLKYTWVVEEQKSGRAHMHMLISCTVPEEELRRHWLEVGGGICVEVSPISGEEMLARKAGYMMKHYFKASAGQESGRDAIGSSNGTGYHSRKAKAKRREYMRQQGASWEAFDKDQYEFSPPDGAGHTNNGDTLTDAEREHYAKIRREAQSTRYIEWEGTGELPCEGVRHMYDSEEKVVTTERVRKVRDSDGGTRIEEIEDGG